MDALAPKRDQELIYPVGSSMKQDQVSPWVSSGLLSTAKTEGPVMKENDYDRLNHTRTQGDWRQEKERGM